MNIQFDVGHELSDSQELRATTTRVKGGKEGEKTGHFPVIMVFVVIVFGYHSVCAIFFFLITFAVSVFTYLFAHHCLGQNESWHVYSFPCSRT